MTTTSSVSTTASTTAATTTASTTTSDSIGSALLTSLGVGTGIDMSTLATNLATAQYASQNDAVNTQLSKVSVQISEATQLKSDLLSLSSSLSSLIDAGGLLPSPTVTNSNVATASLPLGSSGTGSSYTLEVTQLAAPQVLTSGTFASSSSAVQGGTMTFNFGTVSGSTFSPDASHAAATVTIPDGATLAQVATAINNANMGVTAYVANNANGAQLVFKGAQGAANGFTISSADTGSAGNASLSSLTYDPTSSSPGDTVAQSAADAAYKLDGISRTSATNTITNAAPGLSLKLTGTNVGSPTTISYSDPSAGITTAMTNIVAALNSLVTEMNTDTSASTGGLYNDSGAKAMAKAFSQLASTVIMPNATGTDPRTLADLGVSTNKDGSFSLDTTRLANILSTNTSGVAAMFTKGVNGLYAKVFNITASLTSSTDPGSLAGSVKRYTTLQTSLTAQQTSLASQQTTLRARLVSQLAGANTSVATSNSTLSYLKNQIAQWNKTSS